MELRQVKYFAEFAATGSFSEAARRLHITQPAISRQVKLLEEELGVPLLKREGNTASLTPAGEIFYDEAQDLLEHAERVMQRVRALRQETLRIGYIPSLVSALIPRAMARLKAMSKRLRLELLDLTPAEICAAAGKREVDVAIVPLGLEADLKGFQLIEIGRQEPVLVVRRQHALAKQRTIDPQQLHGLPLVGLDRTNFPEYAPRLRAILKPFNIRPVLASQTADGVATLFADLVAADGAAVLTDGIENSLPPGLVVRRFAPQLAALPVFAGIQATRPNLWAQAFVALLKEESEVPKKNLRPVAKQGKRKR